MLSSQLDMEIVQRVVEAGSALGAGRLLVMNQEKALSRAAEGLPRCVKPPHRQV